MRLADRIKKLEERLNRLQGGENRCTVCGGAHVRDWTALVVLQGEDLCSCSCCDWLKKMVSVANG